MLVDMLTIIFRISGGNLNHPDGARGSTMANENKKTKKQADLVKGEV